MKENNKNIDILCVGEVLVDFIGHQKDVRINNTRDYHRYLGGSPTNVAMNSSRLGLNAILISTVGDDGFGAYVLEKLSSVGVDTRHIKQLSDKNTSVIFVSRSEGTPDFIPYRQADQFIFENQISNQLLSKTHVFHTTCFALSRDPARSSILNKAREAYNMGCTLSIDLNYSKKLWKCRGEALDVIKAYCELNPLIKISEDDVHRLFGKKLTTQEIFDFFHNEGVHIVCLTLGSKGVKLSQKDQDVIALPAVKVEQINDSTGAGDAFWSGFLFAYIKEKPIKKCLEVALKLAALKLQNVGRLPDNINIISKLL